MTWREGPVRVQVPATSANLGPGFDSLGLALSLHNVVTAQVTSGGLRIEVSGFGEQSADFGESHLVVRAMRTAFDRLGQQPPGIALRCHNAIPQGFGLGSSAAAITAGLLAARALCGERGPDLLPDPAVLHLAADLEGHADNVAACQAGGLTIAWAAGGSVRSTKLEPLAGLIPVLCVPAEPLATKIARQALPETVSHADAVSNAARAALLIAALTGDPRDLFDATEDFLHQSYRASSMPGSASLLADLRAASVPAVLSGAGPAVLSLLLPPATPEPDIVAAIAAATGERWTVSVLDVDRQGAVVVMDDGPVG
jgi:homoserine kinase